MSPYQVEVHQAKGSRDASVSSLDTRTSTNGSRPSSMISITSDTPSETTSMWSDKEAAILLDQSKTRFNRKGTLVTVWQHGQKA